MNEQDTKRMASVKGLTGLTFADLDGKVLGEYAYGPGVTTHQHGEHTPVHFLVDGNKIAEIGPETVAFYATTYGPANGEAWQRMIMEANHLTSTGVDTVPFSGRSYAVMDIPKQVAGTAVC